MTPAVSGLPTPRDLEKVPESALYVVPRAVVFESHATQLLKSGQAFLLCGNASAFTAVEVVVRKADQILRYVSSVTAFDSWRHVLSQSQQSHFSECLENIARSRPPFAGLAVNETKVMGIVNVTPDSFSDGGDYATHDAAIQHGLVLANAGADILDVGGESTRPGAEVVSADEEKNRVLPVVKTLAEKGCIVSIDTRNASTMAAAIDAGASVVNDVTALSGDAESLDVVVKKHAPVVLMHMQGDPRTMQTAPSYTYAPIDVYDVLKSRVDVCIDAGIDRGSICIDPGIGFGKDDINNLNLLDNLTLFQGLGCPIMLGASRKGFIGRLSNTPDPKDRLPGSLAAALTGIDQGVQILRVHDVAETKQAISMQHAIHAQQLDQ